MVSRREDLRRGLHRLAFRQAGYFTAAQAREVGYSYQAQKYHADRGNWMRVDRGLFQLPEWPAGPEDSYVRWSIWSRGRGVVSHDTALSIHELGLIDPEKVHLTVPPDFGARDAVVVLHVGVLSDGDVVQRDGYRVTTPQRTLLDVAASDLSQEHVDDAVAAAIERGLTTTRRLRMTADAAGDKAALKIERAIAEAMNG